MAFVPVLIVVLILLYMVMKNINRIKGLPPGPTPWPIVGNLFAFEFSTIEHEMLKYKKRYGPVFTLWLPFPTVIINDYEVLKRTVVRQGEAYMGRPQVFFIHYLLGGDYGLLFEKNEWIKSQRRFTLQILKNVGMGQAIMQDAIHHQIAEACEVMRSNPQNINLREILTPTVGNIINQMVFGFTREKGDKEIMWFQGLLFDVFEHFNDPRIALLDIHPAFIYLDKPLKLGLASTKKSNDILVEYLTNIVVERKKTLDYDLAPENYLDAFLHEIRKRENDPNEVEFTVHQLVISIYDLYSAGFETIVTTLLFAFHFLINHPESQRKLFEEIDSTIGREKIVSVDDQKRMPYTSAFLQESYRLGYAIPFNFLRVTMEDVDCEGYRLPSGTRVVPQVVTTQIDEEHYERPLEFFPQRHLKDGEFVRDERINPFSVGKRACPGESLARMEVFLFFVTFIQQFRFESSTPLPPSLETTVSAIRAPKPYLVNVTPLN